MLRFDGTAARQLDFTHDDDTPPPVRPRPRPQLRALAKDVYRELERRRRRAQIAARKYLDD